MKKTQRIIRAEDIDKHQLDQNIADWTHQWIQRALSTEPADHERVERGIKDILLAAGRPEDVPIIWVDSPVVMLATIRAAETANGVSAEKGALHAAILQSIERSFDRTIQHSVDLQLTDYIREHVGASLLGTISNETNAPIGTGISSAVSSAMRKAARFLRDSVIDLKENDEPKLRLYHARPIYDALFRSTARAVDCALGRTPDVTCAPVEASANTDDVVPLRDLAYTALEAACSRIEQYGADAEQQYLGTLIQWDGPLPTGRLEPIRDNNIGPAYYAFFRDVLGLSFTPQRGNLKGKDLLQAYEDALSAGWVWFGECFVVVCEAPIILKTEHRRREPYRLHSPDGPAVVWRDRAALWFVHGTCVPPYVVELPEEIEWHHIKQERNVEVRRFMVDQMGAERLFLSLPRSKVWEGQHDFDRNGFCRTMLYADIGDVERLCAVSVVNATPEREGFMPDYYDDEELWVQDGNRWHRRHIIRVPPWCETPREAVAWTFGLGMWEYDPQIET